MTLKVACLQQDNITNPSLGNKKVSDDTGGNALTASSNGEQQYKGKQYKGKKRGKFGNASKVKCHMCTTFGHYSWDCPKVQEFIESECTKNKGGKTELST